MSFAWVQNPKLQSDTQKRSFLSSILDKAETIGVHNTVEHLLPCLVTAFNSDETIHPDIYDPHANLLFQHLGSLIDFLGREGKKME